MHQYVNTNKLTIMENDVVLIARPNRELLWSV